MTWWKKNNVRLIQTNLQEVDADLNVDALIEELKEFSVNAMFVSAGGIYAFYPTKLEYHHRTPYLKRDLIGEVVDKAHAAGIRVVARFDFSKAHESIFAKKPEWFFRTREGKEVNYQGHVHTCFNGNYQQKYALKILEEAIDNYSIDGVFWNIFGYMNSGSYDGKNYGVCHCDNCRLRFNDMYNLDLPLSINDNDPSYRAYKDFKWKTTRETLKTLQEFVKGKNPNIATFNYSEYNVDLFRNESSAAPSGVRNESGSMVRLQNRLYSTSESVKWVMDTWDGALVSASSVNSLGTYRFAGVSEQENLTRLYQSIASGSGLDYCIFGVFERSPHRSNFPAVKEVFRFHRDNERYFGHLRSVSDIALIKPGGAQHYLSGQSSEYLGMFKMLKEQHVLFDVISQHGLTAKGSDMERYRLVLIPDIHEFDKEELELLARLQRKGVHLLATGRSFSKDEPNRNSLRKLFGAEVESVLTETVPSYLETEEKEVFRHFLGRDWLFMGESFGLTRFVSSVEKLLPYIPPANWAPPEKAHGYKRSEYSGAGILRGENGSGVYLPWEVGTLYYLHGYEDHKYVLFDIIDHVLGDNWNSVQTDAPNCVELFFNRLDDGSGLLQFLNLSGYNGQTYTKPLPVYNTTVTLRSADRPVRAFSLKDRREISVAASDGGGIEIKLDRLDLYEAIVLES